jgi:hypothetical protein
MSGSIVTCRIKRAAGPKDSHTLTAWILAYYTEEEKLRLQGSTNRFNSSQICSNKQIILEHSIATLPGTPHDLVTGSQLDLRKLLIQCPLARRNNIITRTRQVVDPSEECFIVCGCSHSDRWESIGERDLASVQLLETIVSDFEVAT